MNAIENEFAEYQHTYQWLLTLAEITMNSDTPSKKNSVGAAALHVALKEKVVLLLSVPELLRLLIVCLGK